MKGVNSHVVRPPAKQQLPPHAKLAYKGALFEVWQWEQTLFDGSKALFERIVKPDTVLVLPILDNGQAIFAKELQPGMLKPVLHVLGGRMDKGELPEETARRELLEESGYEAGELRLWDAWQPVVKMDWAMYLFVAHGLTKVSKANLDAGEQIELQIIPKDLLLERNANLMIDDCEFLHKLYFAQANDKEHERVKRLLDAQHC